MRRPREKSSDLEIGSATRRPGEGARIDHVVVERVIGAGFVVVGIRAVPGLEVKRSGREIVRAEDDCAGRRAGRGSEMAELVDVAADLLRRASLRDERQ